MVTKNRRITGPNSQPTRPVPNRCSANSAIRMPSESGTTRCDRLGLTTLSPPTAEVTEIAGVIIPSPKNRPAPKMPSVTSTAVRPIRLRRTSAVRAMMPPSPRLCARMMKPAYLIETTIISVQKMSETIPYTPATLGWAALA